MRYPLALTLVALLATDARGTSARPRVSALAKVQSAFGKTIVETFPDGRMSEEWLSPDGSYTGEGRRHDKSSGRWSVRGARLCFKQIHPFIFGYTYCTPIPDVGLGESWKAKAPTGEDIIVKVVASQAGG